MNSIARLVYEAINVAAPGGLGKVPDRTSEASLPQRT